MTAEGEEFSYLISTEDFDKSLLPPDARVPGTEAFTREVTSYLEKDFSSFGGRAQIVIDASMIRVTWQSDPNKPDVLQLAVRKLRQGQYAFGIPILEALRQRRPNDADVLHNLGMALSDMGRLDQAEDYLRQAVKVEPGRVDSHVALGVVLARQECVDKAIADRAEWRADERRWCREGKLPRPGWWKEVH